MSIKAIKELPEAASKPTTRAQIRADIQEAIDSDINLFEFDGDYNYKYLAGYAREVVEEMARRIFHPILMEFCKTHDTGLTWYNRSMYKGMYISIIQYKDEKLGRPRVYCRIEPSFREGFPKFLEDEYNAYLIRRGQREERRNGKASDL